MKQIDIIDKSTNVAMFVGCEIVYDCIVRSLHLWTHLHDIIDTWKVQVICYTRQTFISELHTSHNILIYLKGRENKF